MREYPCDSKTTDAVPMVTPRQQRYVMTDLLRSVSRTFYLTLRILPSALREPIGLAYLLARAADTIADTRLLPPATRLHYLLLFREQIKGPSTPQSLREIALALTDKQSLPAERTLLLALPEAFAMLEALSETDRTLIRHIVVTLSQGMEIDLTYFPAEESGQIRALKDPAHLEQYIYYVAGCVGEFWTRMIRAHTTSLKQWDTEQMCAMGIRFGKALQLTNVLRDVPKDLRIGRCYLPESALIRAGVRPETLLDPTLSSRVRPVLLLFLQTALEYYRSAEEYLLAIPRRCLRLRLAVLWPILIGLATLAKLAHNTQWLDPTQPAKVTRGWVFRLLALSLPTAFSNKLLYTWIAHLRHQVEKAL